MFILLIISFIFCFGYIFYVSKTFGVTSISESYYFFEERKKNLGSLFLLFCIGTSMTLLPCFLNVTKDRYQFISFLSVACLSFVGTVPLYKKEQALQHKSLAYTSIVLSFIWSIFSDMWYLLIAIGAIYVLTFKSDKNLLYIEESCLLSIYISILIKLLQ